ncbi:MSEP-CTERM sorting domain-containing protein [Hymenobacter elongatus]|uniref:MSEP-CTERM sorting domain-containing protein n=1 Tax=Hymenobacter elongatus TaxID=877208 RepID=A0A4Z0PGG1_9BACT|nr:MSEP-CTERM sorting domain-containing protein [Hymenobacter elongatus]TGE14185.1 MSEP-CTERM sorting domain-containing protein [Hymenobacter elongatus]
MRNLLNPKWLFVLNTLPIAVLLLLLGGQYAVVHTLLPTLSQRVWLGLGVGLLALGLLQAAYAGWQLRRGQPLPLLYGILALGTYVVFLYLYGYFLRELFPAEVPRWMVPNEMPLYAGTFLMPTLAHAALVVLICLTPDDQPHRALPNFGIALAVPVSAYLFMQVLLPLWRVPGGEFGEHVMIVLLVTGTLTFLFFLARGVYILISRKTGVWAEYQLLWKALIAIVLPLLGLATNNGLLFKVLGSEDGGVFGNFTGPWFYGLALLNGVLLCWPLPAGQWARLALFVGRSVTFSYTLYFFLVFLPFLPLSVLAVVVVGAGFLMLSPLLLLLVHLRELGQDLNALGSYFPRRLLLGLLIGSGLLLPLAITGEYLYRRHALHRALAYLYTPDYADAARIDAAALEPTLAAVRAHKRSSGDFVFGTQLPYLSSYFNWLVLDNLTLLDAKLDRLEQVFFGRLPNRRNARPAAAAFPTDGPRLTRLSSRSRYDARQATWTSWVDLEVTNATTDANTEYSTVVELPVGCWVQDYYLHINGRREKGILAEKKAATWVFSQIRDEQRDPGILYYLTANRVALRVFPFAAGEVRRTGLRLIHKEPATLHLADRTLTLGDTTHGHQSATPITTAGGQVVYLSAAAKQRLPLVVRRPYFHFLLDASASAAGGRTAYARQVAAFLAAQPAGAAATARYSLVNASLSPVRAGQPWDAQLLATPATGGFYLEGAMRRLLRDARTHPAATYPVLVAVTDSLERAVLPASFAELQSATPEQATFYVLTPNAQSTVYSLRDNSNYPLVAAAAEVVPAVRAWPSAAQPQAYVPDDGQPSIVLATAALQLPVAVGKSWQDGLWLHGYQQYQALYPAAAETMRLSAIRGSFASGIMTPLTSYLALENEAQKAALRRKQNEVLAGNGALDAGEETQPMSEPDVWILLLVLGAWYFVKRYRLRIA